VADEQTNPSEPSPDLTPEEQQKVDELKKKFGLVRPMRIHGRLTVFRKPTRPEWAKFESEPRKHPPGRFDEYTHEDNLILAMCCLGDVTAILDEAPALHGLLFEAVKDLAFGQRVDVQLLGKG
jgi:hypothetical protein